MKTKQVTALLSALMLCGCDKVTTRYATLADAHARNAFDRGWLPPHLPAGASNIVEVNNADLNVGHGTFEFPGVETTGYIRFMATNHNAKVVKSPLGTYITITNATSQWTIQLTGKGGKYNVESIR